LRSAAANHHMDSALMFVGLPTLLAVIIVLTPGEGVHGKVFRVTSVGLLLVAVAAHEGAICVTLAAPLVFGVAHSAAALFQLARNASRTYSLLLLPLLAVVAGE